MKTYRQREKQGSKVQESTKGPDEAKIKVNTTGAGVTVLVQSSNSDPSLSDVDACFYFLYKHCLYCLFAPGSHYAAQAGMVLTVYPRLVPSSWRSCLSLLSVEVKGLNYHWEKAVVV